MTRHVVTLQAPVTPLVDQVLISARVLVAAREFTVDDGLTKDILLQAGWAASDPPVEALYKRLPTPVSPRMIPRDPRSVRLDPKPPMCTFWRVDLGYTA